MSGATWPLLEADSDAQTGRRHVGAARHDGPMTVSV